MRQEFKLDGTPEGNFKKLEKILPRIMSRMGTKTYGVLPASIVHSFNETVGKDGLIFAGCMFAGEIKKVAFRIREIEGKITPEYACVIHNGDETYSFAFNTKKKNYVSKLESVVQDGAFVEIFQVNHTEVILRGIYLSVLVQLNQEDHKVKGFVVDQLLENKDERI